MTDLKTIRAMIPSDDPTKIARVLHRLACGESFTRFDAEHRLHDHALPSTISTLHNEYKIRIDRKIVTVPGYQGKATRCARYRIHESPFNLRRAYLLLKSWGYHDPKAGAMDSPPPEAA